MEAITSAAQSLSAIYGVRQSAPVQRPETPSAAAPVKSAPVMDQYIPEEEHTPSGLYWIGRDKDGSPKVYFDDPEAKPAETCTINTDKVDRELEQLRSRKDQLERQLRTAADEGKVQELEKKLTQTESELARKDNDAYRRQNSVIF